MQGMLRMLQCVLRLDVVMSCAARAFLLHHPTRIHQNLSDVWTASWNLTHTHTERLTSAFERKDNNNLLTDDGSASAQ